MRGQNKTPINKLPKENLASRDIEFTPKRKFDSTAPVGLMGFTITLFAVLLAFYSIYSLFIIMFGMLPGMIAMLVDRDPQRYLTKIVLSFNLSGLAPYVGELLLNTNKATEGAIQMILDPTTWLYIYAYALAGWIVFWFFPNANVLVKSIRVQLKIFELTSELTKLTEEWGEDIKRKNPDK